MSCEIFKVSSETLDKLRELSSEKDAAIRDIVEQAVNSYYDKNCANSVSFVLTDDEEFFVRAKKEHKEKIEALIGTKGPYKVKKTCRSKLGHSEGVYKLENCDFFLPINHFDRSNKQFNTLMCAMVFSWLLALLQSGLLIYLLPNF